MRERHSYATASGRRLDAYEPSAALAPFVGHVPLAPFGRVLVARARGKSAASLPGGPLARWIAAHGVIVLRGFEAFDRASLRAFGVALGAAGPWDSELIDDASPCLLSGARPRVDGEIGMHRDRFAHRAPRYLLFQCEAAPSGGSGGEMLFCDASRLWSASSAIERAAWSLAGDGVAPLDAFALDASGFFEPDDDALAGDRGPLVARLRARLYDPALCYVHTWSTGDIVVADNGSLLHGRAPIASGARRDVKRASIF